MGWGAGPSCLVYDSPGHVTTCSHRSTGQSETRGQRVKPARLFIVCAGCLTAECRQISLKYQHQSTSANWPERGRTEAALYQLVSGNWLNDSEAHFLLIYLFACLLCLARFSVVYPDGRERKEIRLSLSFS